MSYQMNPESVIYRKKTNKKKKKKKKKKKTEKIEFFFFVVQIFSNQTARYMYIRIVNPQTENKCSK